MYSPQVTDRAIAAANAQRWAQARLQQQPAPPELKRHSLAEIDFARSHFDQLWDPDRGALTRPLLPDERAFISNERQVCALDYDYFSRGYCWIVDWKKEHCRYVPNVAQSIIQRLWGEAEEQGHAIWMQQLKARRLGVSTASELAVLHRYQFQRNTAAVVASATPANSFKLAGMIGYAFDHEPWWLVPTVSKIKDDLPVEFGELNSALSIQAGNQFTGVARGDTPNVVHLSELCEWMDPELLIDAALLRAIIDTPNVFGILESTGLGVGNWWHRTWEQNKKEFAAGTARIRPVFLPWYVGTDIYPSPATMAKNPIPPDWIPEDRTIDHAERAREYVLRNPLLFEHLAKKNYNWRMPPEQMYYREREYQSAKDRKELNLFLGEMCVAGETRVSIDQGLVRLDAATAARYAETGAVTRWWDQGEKDVVAVETVFGRQLRVTPEHRLQLADGTWREARALAAGDTLQLSPPRFSGSRYTATWAWTPACRITTTIDEDWARLLGFFLGDGTWGSDAVKIACFSGDPDVVEECQRLCQALTGMRPPAYPREGTRLVVVQSTSVRWWEMLNALGVLEPRIHKKQARRSGYRKHLAVPEAIWRSPQGIVAAFLQGLFESDGHANQHAPQTTFFTRSLSFMREVQLLLLGFGINAQVSAAPKRTKEHVYEGYTLRLNAMNSDRFHERIGFVGARKRSARRRSHQTRAGRNALPITMTDRVARVVPDGRARVYDLTVADTHRFGANGVMVHNCANDFEAFQSSNIAVIDTEVLLSYQERQRLPLEVYTIVGPEIPAPLVVAARHWDRSKPVVNIRAGDAMGDRHTAIYQLIPLLFTGYDTFDPAMKLLVWEQPDLNHKYGVGCDVSEGLGQDNAAIEVLREATPWRGPGQVAEFAYDKVTAFQLWPIMCAIANYYSVYSTVSGRIQQCRAAIECRGTGEAVQYEMQKRGWVNFHPWKRYDNRVPRSDGEVNKIGIYTNAWFRSQMLDMLITAVGEESIEIWSPYLIQELMTLEVEEGQQKAKAAYGSHDDRVMSFGFPLFSLHVGKPPSKQFIRKRIDYAGSVADQPQAHPVWTPPQQASSLGWRPVQQRIAPRRGGGLVRHVNPQLPEGFR